MDAEVTVTIACMMLYVILRRRRRNNRRRGDRRWWVRPMNLNRDIQGDYNNLFQELKQDANMFHRYTRMDVPTFQLLLNMVHPYLLKYNYRALAPELRLVLTLRYLATGDQILSIALAYRIGESTARIIVKEVMGVLVHVLSPLYLRKPTEDEWRTAASDFLERWNFPNCVGAFDGKHVQIQAPPNSGSTYFNYKKTFSIVLMAACDSNYKFTLIHVGETGSQNDAGIFNNCPIGQQLREGHLGLPEGTAELPGSHNRTPCFFVGDEAFPLSTRMMRPFPGRGLSEEKRIFNYRLSRARRVIENAFGILASRWRIYRKPITLHPNAVDNIILSTICLHNFLKSRDEAENPPRRLYCPPNFADREDENGVMYPGRWREEEHFGLRDIDPAPAQFQPLNAIAMRDLLKDYFLTPEGEVPWQWNHIRATGNVQD